jgi:DNA-binding transcriptional LysR family regulator
MESGTMELRHLRYFVAVAEELHFSRAAERLHIAQPAVSQQIRTLEAELGVRLLNRTKRTVSLTDAGAVLLAEARRLLEQVEVARLALQEVSDGNAGRLRIGYTPASLPASVRRALKDVATSTADLRIVLEPGFAHALIAAVRNERLDAAIVSLPCPTTGLRTTHLGHERTVAAVPVSHRHAVQPAIRLEHVAPERIVVLPRDANRPFFDAALAACQRAGLSPSLVETPGTCVEPVLLAVALGAGVALLPESVADRYSTRGVRFIPIEGDQPVVASAAVTRRDSTHLPTAAFVRALSRTQPEVALGASRAPVAAVA